MSSVMRFDEWQDSNGNPVASGVGGVFTAPGSVLQVVSTTKTDAFSASIAGRTKTAVTGLSTSITPSSTSSKILVLASVNGAESSNYGVLSLFLKRDSTEISLGDTAGARTRTTQGARVTANSANDLAHVSVNYLDSPASTSSITYSFDMFNNASTTQTVYVNRTSNDADNDGNGRYTSSITLLEIAG